MIYCRGCNREAPGVDRDELTGWYRVQIKGDERLYADDVQPGFYCSKICLTVACFKAWNVPPVEVRAWLADVTGATAPVVQRRHNG